MKKTLSHISSDKSSSENLKTRSVFRFFRHDFCFGQKSGFAMLFSVLVSSLLMAIGLSMYNISVKELAIAASQRDSQIAYYVADSARECAAYWNLNGQNSDGQSYPPYQDQSSTEDPQPYLYTPNNIIRCNGNNITLNFSCVGDTCKYSTTTFLRYSATSVLLPESGVYIEKIVNPSSGLVSIKINSYGHNSGIINKRVERIIPYR